LQRAGYRKETQKVSAEGERSNVLYCMYNTLQSGQVAKKKMHRVSAQMYLRATVQDGVSGPDTQLPLFAAKVQIWPLLSIHTLKSAMLVTKYVRNLMQI
jgi:hypothetical protein